MIERIKIERKTKVEDAPLTPRFKAAQYLRYRNMLFIDQMRLTEQLMELPTLLMDVGEYCAEAIAARDYASNYLKEEVSRSSAYLRSLVRETNKLPSETLIASEVFSLPTVINATARLEDAKRDAGYWSALMDSARSKSSSLKVIADLTITGYLSPSTAYANRKTEMASERKLRQEHNDGGS